MILILEENTDPKSAEYQSLMDRLAKLPNITARVHHEQGTERGLFEVYLIGSTTSLNLDEMRSLPCVERVVRISEEYRVLGRHKDETRPTHFDYNGVRFGQDTLHVFAGLCAVDTPGHVELMMKALREQGQVCTRMGAYKPRTSPYAFQGHGKQCLPYVFELAGQVRHQGDRDGGDPRVPHRRDPRRRSIRRATPPASCSRSAPATPRTSSC